MSAKKSTATKQAQAKVSSPSEFKKLKKGRPLLLPSGLVVKARKVELRTFVSGGDVPNALLPVVEEALNKGRQADIDQIIGKDGHVNEQMIEDMLVMVDRVAIQVVVEPKVHPVPENEDDRDDDLLYVDELDDEDKMFIFQWSSGQGTEDIEQFRREAAEGLAAVAEG